MTKLRWNPPHPIPHRPLPPDAQQQIKAITKVADPEQLVQLCKAVELAGDTLLAIRLHEANADNWTVARDRLDALADQYQGILRSLSRLDGDALDLIGQHHFLQHREWIDLDEHYQQIEKVSATITRYRATFPKGKQKDHTLGDTLVILCEAYTAATGRPATHRATRFLDFLNLIGPWIELPASDLERHLRNIGTK